MLGIPVLSLVHMRDVYQSVGCNLSYVESEKNTSDITTKHLNAELHWVHVSSMLLKPYKKKR